MIAATAVETDDGRLALLVEMEPDVDVGPLVVDSIGDASTLVNPAASEHCGYIGETAWEPDW